MFMFKMVNVVFCVLGGFIEMIKLGCEVKVIRIFFYNYMKFSLKFIWSEFYV